jgi:hypothetical protein
MAGFWRGLTNIASQGVLGAEAGREDTQRRLLAAAARKRQESQEDEAAQLRRIQALREAREAGLDVRPVATERSGDVPPTTNPAGPSVSSEAGPAAKAKPTRIGTVAGMDISIPEKYESKAVRDARSMREAGMGPKQTLPERIAELRGQGMKPEEAVRTARMEFGQLDPVETRRRIHALGPAPSSKDSGSDAAEKRAAYVLRRAAQLTRPTTNYLGVPQPGMSRAEAEQMAGEEYDRRHQTKTGVAPPSAQPGQTGNIQLPPSPNPTTQPTAGAGGAGDKKVEVVATAAQQARAAVDPQYKAFLKAKGVKVQ